MKMTQQVEAAESHSGQYVVRVPMKSQLDAAQVSCLVRDLQLSFDNGTAGAFKVVATDLSSMVVFYREISDDLEVLQGNIASKLLTDPDPAAAAVKQLAEELALHQESNALMQELVTTLRARGAELLDLRDGDMIRASLCTELVSA